MIIDKATAISSLVPNSEFTTFIDGSVEWHKPTSAPVTDEQIEAEIIRLKEVEVTRQEAETAAKESALSKLTALGLTADEVKALLGVK